MWSPLTLTPRVDACRAIPHIFTRPCIAGDAWQKAACGIGVLAVSW